MRRALNDPQSGSPFLSREDCEAIGKKVFGMLPSGMSGSMSVGGGIGAGTEFSRSDIWKASATNGIAVSLRVDSLDRKGSASATNATDAALREMVDEAVAAAGQWGGKPRPPRENPPKEFKTPPKVYFEKNLALMEPGGRGEIMTAALDAVEKAGLNGAGKFTLGRVARAVMSTDGLFAYSAETGTSFSLTARTKDGTGSGWAWCGYEDWVRNDPKAVIDRAIDLALRSKNPVAVEPGRYTVVMEPSAVADLVQWIGWDAFYADLGMTVFSKDPLGTNKIGLQMTDRRLNMVSDPWDTEAPRSTLGYNGEAVDRQQWFKDGVLRDLSYSEYYAKQKNRLPSQGPMSLRLWGEGPKTSFEDMIASTKRGIWVNRFSGIGMMNARTLLLSGTTRDGTFLIENGKITKPIKNLRFTESPFFVFNKLDAFGETARASNMAVAPRMKVRDFDFTSLTDAV